MNRYAVIKVADFGMAAFIQKDGMLKGRYVCLGCLDITLQHTN